MNNRVKRFYPKTLKEWRNWLKENHKKESKIAVVYYKKHTGKPSLPHKEAMREAICFGWIDTTAKRLDAQRYMVHFVKRNKNSKANIRFNKCFPFPLYKICILRYCIFL